MDRIKPITDSTGIDIGEVREGAWETRFYPNDEHPERGTLDQLRNGGWKDFDQAYSAVVNGLIEMHILDVGSIVNNQIEQPDQAIVKPVMEEEDMGDDDVEVIDSILIPEGEYILKYCWHETQEVMGGAKVKIVFELAEGNMAGATLDCFYPVRALKGPPGRYGKFKISKQQKYYAEIVNLFPGISRGDRSSPRRLNGRLVVGRVETVKTDWDKKTVPEELQYSKVAELLRLLPDEQVEKPKPKPKVQTKDKYAVV